MLKYTFYILVLTLIGCMNIKDDEDEKLIVPLKLPGEGWKSIQKETQNTLETQWSSNSENGMMKIIILHNSGGFSAFGQMLNENSAAKNNHCNVFESKSIPVGGDNGFNTVAWKTICTNHGEKTILLRKNISGYDSFYSIFRRWNNDVQDKEFNEWVDYFNTIHLCKPGWKGHPCPSDL